MHPSPIKFQYVKKKIAFCIFIAYFDSFPKFIKNIKMIVIIEKV